MQETSIKKYFEDDHNRLDELFTNFQKYKKQDFAKAKEYFKEFKFGLQRHIVWEEEILFPIFEEKSGISQGGPTFVMRIEHKQIGEYLELIHKKVQIQDTNSDKEEEILLATLSKHNVKEENILYPAIDNMVTDEERIAAFNQMNNLPEERYKKCCSHS